MFNHLESIGGGFERKLQIAPRNAVGKNWFTVFIAENGGRKSFLLRCIAEAALGRRRYAVDKGRSIQLTLPETLPHRVVAISGTPLDRFPRAGTRDLKSKSRRSNDDFVYLGPRASNGMAGVAQSERSLIGSLISNRHRLPERADLLKRAFSLLELAPFVDVALVAGSNADARDIKDTATTVAGLNDLLGLRDDEDRNRLAEAIKTYVDLNSEVLKTLEGLGRREVSLRVGVGGIPMSKRPLGLTLEMWELLLRLGRVIVMGTKFYRSKNLQAIPGEQLSSGQWGWLGTFGALVAEMRNDTLILVDEPENSLHPRWQQEFIKELHAIVSAFENCQVVVATHSPLIASGVSPDWGSIRTLTRPSRSGAFVRSQEVPTAYGWSASDVYDGPFGLVSTRAPEFLASANAALKKLSAGATIEDAERVAWIDEFQKGAAALPTFDSMRDVLENIVQRLSALSRPRPAGRKARG
jgi:hypothetical protein